MDFTPSPYQIQTQNNNVEKCGLSKQNLQNKFWQQTNLEPSFPILYVAIYISHMTH